MRKLTCLVNWLLDCLRFGAIDCKSEIMLSAWSKCNNTTSDSRSIRERKTLHPFNRWTMPGRSRTKGSKVLPAQSGCWPVSDSTLLISVLHLSSSPRVKFVSISMIRTGRSNGCRAWGADLARNRLRRGIDSRSGSVVQCKKAYVLFFSESQKAVRTQNGQWWNSVLKTYAASVNRGLATNRKSCTVIISLWLTKMPCLGVDLLGKRLCKKTVVTGYYLRKSFWQAEWLHDFYEITVMIFMKSDRDQKTVLSLQRNCGSMQEYLMKV